jgi:hypothetical protein
MRYKNQLLKDQTMDWQTRLINTYLTVSELWDKGLCTLAQRMSNNQEGPLLSDEEVLTIYLNGVMMGRSKLKSIYNFTFDHLKDWFPNLCSYESFVRRLNNLDSVFPEFIRLLQLQHKYQFIGGRFLVDSLPVIMASSKRSNRAKVSPEIADKGFNATKNMYFYGVKIHILAKDVDGSIPTPVYIGLSPASVHDRTVFDQIAPELYNCDGFGDKAYASMDENIRLKKDQNLQVSTPVKLKPGQKHLDATDSLYSRAVSSIKQPIESLFNWIIEKTGIQQASKVRSTKGLMVHVFGKMTAAIMLYLNH